MKKITAVILVAAGFLCSGAFATETKRPNLLVLLTDDQRPDTLGCYAPDRPLPTPNIDKLAADGIRFTQGFVTTPICAVSRACILTGRYACNARMTRFRSVMSEEVFENSYNMLLQKAGYYTGQLGKYGVRSTKEQIARFDFFDGSQDQGPPFREYKGKTLHDSEWLTQRTSDFLDSVPEGSPFCLQVNYKAPHFSAKPAPEDDHLLDDYTFPRDPLDNENMAAIEVPEVMDGRSLVSLISGLATRDSRPACGEWRSHFFFEHYHSGANRNYIARNEGIRTLDAKYLRWVDSPEPIEEVYDLRKDPMETRDLTTDPEQQARVKQLRARFDAWRAAHPANFAHDPYGRWATFNAPEINWDRFKKAHPEEYARIAKEVERLGVTWEQALNDWDTRTAIWKATRYYY